MNKKNAEGYDDLPAGLRSTAYEALTAAVREEKQKAYRPLVYICSPFAGNIPKNTERARRYCRFAVEQGAIPLAPHLLYPQFMNESNKADRALGIFFGTVLLGKCAEVWAFGGRTSHGMKLELSKARKRGIPIKFFNENCEVL